MNDPRNPTRRPKVAIVSASVGAGHNQAARALADSLGQTCPQIDVTTYDAMQHVPRWYRLYYAGGFAFSVTRLPRGYGFGYWASNHPQGPRLGLMERLRLWQERLTIRSLTELVLSQQPDLVVNTHFLLAPAMGRLIGQGKTSARQFTVVTDIEVHRFWNAPHVQRWFVPSEYSAQPLRRWGIPPETITVSGIPVHPKWSVPLDREKVLTDWNLPRGRKIVLLSGGTEFVCAPVPTIAQRLLDLRDDLCVVVLAGRNKDLLGTLAKMPQAESRLFPIAFTDRVHELVGVSSLMLTKPGGMTTAECLAKGTPMILMRPVPGQEGGNARYLSREGAAVVANSVDEIASAASRLLSDSALLARMSAQASRLYLPGCQTITEAIRQAVCGE